MSKGLIKPEKALEEDVLAWAFQRRWSLDVYNSVGQFSASAGRYVRNKGMKTGTPDLCGSDDLGHAVYLELKKPGKGKVCRLLQRQFLERKLEAHSFCLVVDDLGVLETTYSLWLSLRNKGQLKEASLMLKNLLPKKVLVDGKTITLES